MAPVNPQCLAAGDCGSIRAVPVAVARRRGKRGVYLCVNVRQRDIFEVAASCLLDAQQRLAHGGGVAGGGLLDFLVADCDLVRQSFFDLLVRELAFDVLPLFRRLKAVGVCPQTERL